MLLLGRRSSGPVPEACVRPHTLTDSVEVQPTINPRKSTKPTPKIVRVCKTTMSSSSTSQTATRTTATSASPTPSSPRRPHQQGGAAADPPIDELPPMPPHSVSRRARPTSAECWVRSATPSPARAKHHQHPVRSLPITPFPTAMQVATPAIAPQVPNHFLTWNVCTLARHR